MIQLGMPNLRDANRKKYSADRALLANLGLFSSRFGYLPRRHH